MKRKIWLWILVCVVAVAVLAAATNHVTQQGDQVEYTAYISSGSNVVLRDLSIRTTVQYDYQKFWDVVYTSTSEGDFCRMTELSQDQLTERFYEDGRGKLEIVWMYPMRSQYTIKRSVSDAALDVEAWRQQDAAIAGMYPILMAVEERCQPGESYTETVLLQDYMEYYPLDVVTAGIGAGNILYIEHDGEVKTSESMGDWDVWLAEGLRDYFKIPVLEDHRIQVTVEKDAAGAIVSISYQETENFWNEAWEQAQGMTAAADNGIYVIWNPSGDDLDYSEFSLGYGVYHVPFEMRDGKKQICLDQVRMIYGLEPGWVVTDLSVNEEGSSLAWCARASDRDSDGKYQYQVMAIDIRTGQEIPLVGEGLMGPETIEEWIQYSSFDGLLVQEDYLIAATTDRVMVYQINQEGDYELQLSTDRNLSNNPIIQTYVKPGVLKQAQVLYDGTYLILCDFLTEEKYPTCDFYVLAYGGTNANPEISFIRFESSLDTGISEEDDTYRVAPIGRDPMKIWKEPK